MKRAVVISKYGMGEGDPGLSISLLEKYLTSSIENEDIKDYYLFYNKGVCAALENANIVNLLKKVSQAGAMIYFCGVCLEYYGLGDKLKVGKICCMNDIRQTLNETRADFL